MDWEQPRDPALLAQRPQPTEAEITPSAVEWMFVCFSHDRSFFDDARGLIQEVHFLPHEESLKYLWRVLCLVIPQYGGVTYEGLRFTYEQILQQDPNMTLNQRQLEIIFHYGAEGLLYSVANPPPGMISAPNVAMARSLFRKFLMERSVIQPLRRVLQPGFAGGVPSNLGSFLQVVEQQHARLSALDSLPVASVVPDMTQPIRPAFDFKLTGTSYIDEPLGGQRVGDANGLIGPTGGGKTTLALHAAVNTAKQCWTDFILGKPKEVSVFVTVEEPKNKLLPRVWSSAFLIPREKLETMTDFGALTTQANIQDYERRLAQSANLGNGECLSETDRFKAGLCWLPQHFILLDLSGSEEHPTAGYGYIDEIASYLSRLQDQLQVGFRSVYLDYAGLLIERHMEGIGQANNDRVFRSLLRSFGDQFKRKISERFQTTSWLLHQLKGEMGTANPTKLMHHSDAAESKDFAVNMAVCGCLGTADPQTGCRRLNWSKVRYRAGERIMPSMLRVHEQFALMEDVSSLYTIDESGNQFVTREDMREIGGLQSTQQRRAPMTGSPPVLRDTSQPVQQSGAVDPLAGG